MRCGARPKRKRLITLNRTETKPYSFRNRRTFEPEKQEKRTMTIWNVTAHKPTNVTHSCVGNFTSPQDLNLIIAYLLILFPFPRVPFFSFIFISTYLPFHFVFLPGNARASRFTCFLPKACRFFLYSISQATCFNHFYLNMHFLDFVVFCFRRMCSIKSDKC